MNQRTCHGLLTLLAVLMIFPSLGRAAKTTGPGGAIKITSVAAEFTQEKHMRILSRPLVSEGVLYYQAPASFRWEYRTPIRSIFLMHDGKAKRYVQGKDGLTEERGAGVQSLQFVLPQMTGWLTGRIEEKGPFTAVFEGERKLVLTPVQEAISKMISRIEIVLSNQLGMVESVTIYESEDSYTRLAFHNAVLNQKVAESLFIEK